jgi:hypothetical protein
LAAGKSSGNYLLRVSKNEGPYMELLMKVTQIYFKEFYLDYLSSKSLAVVIIVTTPW